MVCFRASQSVEIGLPGSKAQIQRYFSSTERLVYALIDPNRVEVLEPNLFRFSLRPLNFMMLNLEPVADVHIEAARSRVMIASDHCLLRGQDALNKRFSLKLRGWLQPRATAATQGHPPVITLVGEAHLQVTVDLPAAFRFTPRGLLEATGNSLLSGILLTIKQRLRQQLLANYMTWEASERALKTGAIAPLG